ncbi:MAG: hypothetical protein LBT05_01865 [Planctomycetaceae bacterium]|jgi:hypothetical protein|nr:hypothetical protein [Planctomycetaceae bacterium]
MRNMLENGLHWLSRQQKFHASSVVAYRRGDKQFLVHAVLGRTKYDSVDENGFRIASFATDFLIEAKELRLIPQAGDQIIVSQTIHEVIDLGDGCWRWCDPHEIRRRIHTGIFKGEER